MCVCVCVCVCYDSCYDCRLVFTYDHFEAVLFIRVLFTSVLLAFKALINQQLISNDAIIVEDGCKDGAGIELPLFCQLPNSPIARSEWKSLS